MEFIISLAFFCAISVIIINFFLILFATPFRFSSGHTDSVSSSPNYNQPPAIEHNKKSVSSIASQEEKKECALVKDAIAMISLRYQDPYFTIERLADSLGTSKRNLQRKFKSEVNSSPSKELKKMRIKCALEGLERGDKIKNVVEMAGFSSQSYFCKCFKEETGLTPSEFISESRCFS